MNSRWSDDELDEREYPEPDEYDDDSVDTLECPKCGCDVYEEAEQCPYCGHYLTHDTRVWSGKPWWWIAMGLLGIAAMLIILLAEILF